MKRLILLLALSVALLAPAGALASGVVLKVQPSSHLVAVTRSAATVRVLGRAHTVRFRGLLLSRSRTQMVVSAGGAVLTIHRASRSTSSARDSGPKPGSQVAVTATVGTD